MADSHYNYGKIEIDINRHINHYENWNLNTGKKKIVKTNWLRMYYVIGNYAKKTL